MFLIFKGLSDRAIKICTSLALQRTLGIRLGNFRYQLNPSLFPNRKQWCGESEAAGDAARLMPPPPPQSYFFASWSGTRVMS